jgi:hypothetical protein
MVQALPPEHLERTNILQQILEHIEDFKEQFPKVDYAALKRDVLEPVVKEQFDPEVQIRGFLRTFQDTEIFKDAFEQIKNSELQAQVNAFIQGSSAKDAVGKAGFQVSAHPSPAVKHHFSLLQTLKKILLCGIEAKEDVNEPLHSKITKANLEGLPLIYEDVNEKKIMEVR